MMITPSLNSCRLPLPEPEPDNQIALTQSIHIALTEPIHENDCTGLKDGTPFKEAVRLNFDPEKARQWLETLQILQPNSGINDINAQGRTALLETIYRGDDPEIIEFILNLNANVNGSNADGLTALMKAALQANHTAIRLLLQRQADINQTDNDGHSALTLAIYDQSLETVNLLLSYNANINSATPPKIHPLIYAIGRDEAEIMESLIANKADPNCFDLKGNSPFKEAVRYYADPKRVCHMLGILGILKPNSDINDTNAHEKTALMEAVRVGDPEIIEFLLKLNANVNGSNAKGVTALMDAVGYRNIKLITQLLQKQANIDQVNYIGTSALIRAVKIESFEATNLLLSHDPNIHQVDGTGLSALGHALFSRAPNKEIIRILKEKDSTNKAEHYAITAIAIKKMVFALDVDGEVTLQHPDQFQAEKITMNGCPKARQLTELIPNELREFNNITEILSQEFLEELVSIYTRAIDSFGLNLEDRRAYAEQLFLVWQETPEKKGKEIVFYSGHNTHLVGFIISGPWLIICNRGDGCEGEQTILCYEMDPNKFSPEIILDILHNQDKTKADYQNLIQELFERLNLRKTHFENTIEHFAHVPKQDSGSCVRSNSAGTLLPLLILMAAKKGYNESNLPGLIKQQQVTYDSWNVMIQVRYTENYLELSRSSCYGPYLPLLERVRTRLRSTPKHIIEPISRLVQQTLANIEQILPPPAIPAPSIQQMPDQPFKQNSSKTASCCIIT